MTGDIKLETNIKYFSDDCALTESELTQFSEDFDKDLDVHIWNDINKFSSYDEWDKREIIFAEIMFKIKRVKVPGKGILIPIEDEKRVICGSVNMPYWEKDIASNLKRGDNE